VVASLAKHIESDYSPVLEAIFELLLSTGMQKADVRRISARSLEKARKKCRGSGRREGSGGLPMAALVLDAWHRDRRYLNARAEPRAVRLLGPAPSVEALIRAEGEKEHAHKLAQRLESLRLVVPLGRGLYKPTGDVALISKHDPFVLQHIAKSLSVLLETIRSNLDSDPTSEALIERFAEVPDLPLEYIPTFKKFSKTHGWILLRTVNDWLESRRAKRTNRRRREGIRAGIHVHAYVARDAKL